MTTLDTGGIAAAAPAAGGNRCYFIAWRWHFYAGLFVIPFLLVLAVTGLIMLWVSATTELNGERARVTPGGAALPVSALQAAAEAEVPGGSAVQYIAPMGEGRVAAFAIAAGDAKTGVTLDPYTGKVVETFPWGGGWYDLASEIHGTLLLGDFGDRLIEIAASLGMVMVATGLYLHWPRDGRGWGATLVPRLGARGRGLWKSLHGAVGIWMALILVVFLLSGLSWSGIWGERFVQAWSTFPAAKWEDVPLSDATHAGMNHGPAKEVPWALEQTPLPASGSLAGHAAVAAPVTVDGVAAFAQSLGFDRRFQIHFPEGETGVWTISHDSMSNDGPNPAADRTIHIDRHTGNVLADVRYADYSVYAKAMAWGIAFHEGDLGAWNLALNTLFCLAMIFLPVSGLVMWWKRRPARAGRLAAPPRPREAAVWKGALVVMVGLGLAFPLAGAAMLAVVLLDATLLRLFPGLRQALS
jgi:uncharacterized iron-regulated membrane protein